MNLKTLSQTMFSYLCNKSKSRTFIRHGCKISMEMLKHKEKVQMLVQDKDADLCPHGV